MKKEIRKKMKDLRNQMNILEKRKLDQSIVEHIKKDKDFINAQVVAFYMPMTNEIDVLPIYDEQKTFLIPRMDKDQMVFVKYHPMMKFEISNFGVKEPCKDAAVYNCHIDYMVIPALAISKSLHRIGYGKAYYDRFIFKNRPSKVVGVIYPFQEISTFDHEVHDQKLDGYFIGEL